VITHFKGNVGGNLEEGGMGTLEGRVGKGKATAQIRKQGL